MSTFDWTKVEDTISDDMTYFFKIEALTTVLLERERVRNRAEHLETEPNDLVPIIQQVVEGFGGREPGIVCRDFPGEVMANVDPALIKVLVQNLADNALKFSGTDSDKVQIGLGIDSGEVILTVDDDGPGIPPEETERVLEPFVKLDPARGHRKGYGLGLNLCQRIVQAHKGTIHITARVESGTRVEVRLPV